VPACILDIIHLHADGSGHACTHTRTHAPARELPGQRASAVGIAQVIAIIFYSPELCLRGRESAGAEASNFGGGGGFALGFKAGRQSAGLRRR